MSGAHLTSEELDLVLIGEGLPVARAGHLSECLLCRRRRDELAAAIHGAALPDPGPAARARVRAAALSEAMALRPSRRWWPAAAAALILVAAAAVFVPTATRQPAVDTDAILLEVDEVLSRDPLAAMADESVLEVVVADSAGEVQPQSSS